MLPVVLISLVHAILACACTQVVGKPQPSFFRLALDDLGVPPEAAAMVGDDVCDDVGGAMKCGMAGILGEPC